MSGRLCVKLDLNFLRIWTLYFHQTGFLLSFIRVQRTPQYSRKTSAWTIQMPRVDLKLIPTTKQTIVLAESEFGEAAADIDSDFIRDMMDKSRSLRLKYTRALRGTNL